MNDDSIEYFEARHPELKDLKIDTCYLCGKELNGESEPDHIIPKTLFRKGSQKRPTLPTHHLCNNGKSKEDEQFLHILSMMSLLNPEAQNVIDELIVKANQERPKEYLIGHRINTRNLRKAQRLTKEISWGPEFIFNGDSYATMQIGEENFEFIKSYVSKMSRGLFLRNVPNSNSKKSEVHPVYYAKEELRNNSEAVEAIKRLVRLSKNSGFTQRWGDRVAYVGSNTVESLDEGFVYFHVFGQVGFLARIS